MAYAWSVSLVTLTSPLGRLVDHALRNIHLANAQLSRDQCIIRVRVQRFKTTFCDSFARLCATADRPIFFASFYCSSPCYPQQIAWLAASTRFYQSPLRYCDATLASFKLPTVTRLFLIFSLFFLFILLSNCTPQLAALSRNSLLLTASSGISPGLST